MKAFEDIEEKGLKLNPTVIFVLSHENTMEISN